jgi:hypothetical protein
VICLRFGKLVDGRVYLEKRSLSIGFDVSRLLGEAGRSYVQAMLHLSRTQAYVGDIDYQARLRRDEVLPEARRLSPYNLVVALTHAWYVDWEGSLWETAGNLMHGWCVSKLGQSADGIPLLLKGISDLGATGCNIPTPFLLIAVVDMH